MNFLSTRHISSSLINFLLVAGYEHFSRIVVVHEHWPSYIIQCIVASIFVHTVKYIIIMIRVSFLFRQPVSFLGTSILGNL